MKNNINYIEDILRDKQRQNQLLAYEKQRRGVSVDTLVFVGIHNIAQHWWCTQQAVLKSRYNESEFFAVYLSDRIRYAQKLGLIKRLPSSDEALLEIGSEITLSDIQGFLKEKEKQQDKYSQQSGISSITKTDKQGNQIIFINPDMPEEDKDYFKEMAEADGIRIGDLNDDPVIRGDLLHSSQAEQFPSIRWNFPWMHYTVIGIPDGITDSFIYEYKTTKKRFFFSFVKPVALAQADLYGYFFHRANKRVQIQIMEENITETFEEPISISRAERTLLSFDEVARGKLPHPPKAWKCSSCDFQTICPINDAV